jgi:hypothetical protein
LVDLSSLVGEFFEYGLESVLGFQLESVKTQAGSLSHFNSRRSARMVRGLKIE